MAAPFDARSRGVGSSFAAAWDGLTRTVVTQRNMRIHCVAGLMVMMVGMSLPLDLASRVPLAFCVFLVLAIETLNTSLEGVVDLYIQEHHQLAKLVKDCSAGAVLVLAVGAVALLADILVNQAEAIASNWPAIRHTLLFGLPLTFAQIAMLFLPYRPGWLNALLLVEAGLLVVLGLRSTDPVFTILAASLVLLARLARARHRM